MVTLKQIQKKDYLNKVARKGMLTREEIEKVRKRVKERTEEIKELEK